MGLDAEEHARLVAAARAGDEEALSTLFADQTPRLARMIELRLDPRLRARLDPSDVLQDAWIDVVQRFANWRAQDSLPLHVWLRLVTSEALVHAQRSHLGAKKRDAGREVAAAESRANLSAAGFADAFVASQTTPTQALRREEVRSRVLAALEGVDEMDREIVALRHFEGLSNEDAAAELGIDPATASKRFVRALVRLRPVLKGIAPDDGGGAR